jgi:hypothetical protein
MREHDSFLFWSINLLIMMAILCAVVLNPIHKKHTEKPHKPKPVDRTKIILTDVNGNVESIHPWGRTEVVPMKSVELEYFQYCDEWVMYGDVVQPVDRKNYFMPVLKGHLDLDVNETTTTWVEYGKYWTGLSEDEKSYEDFRVALIKVIKGRIVNIKYTHYRLDSNGSWSIIASWEAEFNDRI